MLVLTDWQFVVDQMETIFLYRALQEEIHVEEPGGFKLLPITMLELVIYLPIRI